MKYTNKQKLSRFFVFPENDPALVGMPDINVLNILAIRGYIIEPSQ